MSNVELTRHFIKRFYTRVARTKRVQLFARRAYYYEIPSDRIQNKQFSALISKQQQMHHTYAKIYSNCVYWFDGNRAVTVWPLPQSLHGKV